MTRSIAWSLGRTWADRLVVLGTLAAATAGGISALHGQSPADAPRIRVDKRATPSAAPTTPTRTDESLASVLSPAEWARVDAAVERGLKWLAAQQQPDGSFPTHERAQPAITGLCMLAFMAHGNLPGEGPYGQALQRATEFIANCQRQNGLLSSIAPDVPTLDRNVELMVGIATAYSHSIGGLTLSEVYGLCGPERARALQPVIERALVASLEMQRWPKDRPHDEGGWRYLHNHDQADSDMSITGWELMFLRSSRNAGFDVPKERIDEAVTYIRGNFDPNHGAFGYLTAQDPRPSRATAGAGILALAHAGLHHTPEAQTAGEFLLQHTFEEYNGGGPSHRDRYHYGVLPATQAMYQLGGRFWREFFPPTVKTLLASQQPDGAWPVESQRGDGIYGSTYTTALVVISLGAPNQLLPVFQR